MRLASRARGDNRKEQQSAAASLTRPSGVSAAGDRLGASEVGSLKILASALVDLAIQILGEDKEMTEEAEAA